MAKPAYMPVKVADSNISTYMKTHVPRAEYAHKVFKRDKHGNVTNIWKDCASCDGPLEHTIERYEVYGNWCQSCNSKLRARKLTESELNVIFRGQTNQLYHDIYKENIDYPTLQKLVAKELATD